MVRVVSCRVPTTRWEYKPPLQLAFEAREGGWVVVSCVKTRNTLQLAFEEERRKDLVVVLSMPPPKADDVVHFLNG